jgi:hypothetical protein
VLEALGLSRREDWLELKAVDPIFLHCDDKRYRERARVKSIQLYRVFPIEYNDLVVESAQAWMDGITRIDATLFLQAFEQGSLSAAYDRGFLVVSCNQTPRVEGFCPTVAQRDLRRL